MTDPLADLELIDLEPTDASPVGTSPRRERLRVDGRSDGRPAGRSRLTVIVVGLIAVVMLVWGVLAYQRLDSVRGDLLSAREQLDLALDAFGDGDMARAGALMDEARVTFDAVPRRTGGPAVLPVRLLPGPRRTLDAVADLSDGAALVTGSIAGVTEVLEAQGGGLGALTPRNGQIPIDTFRALTPVLDDASTAIPEAVALVAAIPRAGIDPEVRDARDSFLELVEPAAAQAAVARDVVAAMPAMFGGEGLRRYMVLASNPTEARGTGGFYGAFTILEADDGELSFSQVRETQELPRIPRGQIPWPDPSLDERYDAYGGTGFILNLNMTPDFPMAATAIETFYEEATGEALDGVIAVDPFAFEALLEISGPIEIPGYGTVGPDEVVEFVSRDAYAVILDPIERKRLIGLVATIALQGFLDSPDGVSASGVMSALGAMVERTSIQAHAADPDEQAALAALGLDGALAAPDGSDFIGVFLNSGAPYKVDYWLERYLRYDVVLAPGGQSVGTLSTGFANGAPTSGEVTYMIGFGGGDPLDAGDVLSFVSVYCAPGCRFYDVPDAGFEGLETEQGVELDHGVTSTWMRLPAEQARELVWTYMTPGTWTTRGLDRVYRLHYDHQTSILPIQLDIRIAVPEGYVATGLPDGAVEEDGVVRVGASAISDLDLEVVFSPS